MDQDQWLADFQARVQTLQQQSQELQENLATATTTVSSPDESVTVTVAPNGGLQNLVLGHRACEAGPARLTAMIMETVRQGQRLAAHKVAEAFAPIGAGTEAMSMLTSHLPELDEADERELATHQDPSTTAPTPSTPSAVFPPNTPPSTPQTRPAPRPHRQEPDDDDDVDLW
ncbi:hypothetical protein GCM10012275_22720 [Longimycelium tulufanense]|uniref:YbaB/EbfC DNA-binding family protein n=1 Tax=Longimycelium tulufanense TaxID=907463 RepID=A0A8J3CD54_9PSEU|nr:YbaB/EbfC family nucleoid-associated protein [Longimycelium tulufanense]GGM51251.1 hypothetical protein GCM10012275_22720 [Longimycelium tulufanense]